MNSIDDKSIVDSAMETIEDSLPSLSTELLQAFRIVLNPYTFVKDTNILPLIDEALEIRKNAAA